MMNPASNGPVDDSTLPIPGDNEMVIHDYLRLMYNPKASRDERLLKQDLAKKNYLNIHKKRKKR
jgi:hypothetical protein